MKYVKLTDNDMSTYGGFMWEVGKKVTTSGEGMLCGPGWLHCYGADTIEQAAALAVMLNPIHADFDEPKMFEAEVGGQGRNDNGVKYGFTEMTLVTEIELPLPEITLAQRAAFAILCAREVYRDENFRRWAEKWLSGEDVSVAAARATARATARAAEAAWAAARATAWLSGEDVSEAAARAAAWAAARAAEAARAEVWAVKIGSVNPEKRGATRAEVVRAWAARAAEEAAWAARAAAAGSNLNLGALAEKSKEYLNEIV